MLRLCELYYYVLSVVFFLAKYIASVFPFFD